MGIYIDVEGNTTFKEKRDWCIANGEELQLGGMVIDGSVIRDNPSCITNTGVKGNKEILVCVVNNGNFAVIGVAYNKQELEIFTEPDDIRTSVYYYIPKDIVLKHIPEGRKDTIEAM